ncbi:RNA-binding protein 39, partial [Cucurbita argyrosperma subsp. argyrosperma]
MKREQIRFRVRMAKTPVQNYKRSAFQSLIITKRPAAALTNFPHIPHPTTCYLTVSKSSWFLMKRTAFGLLYVEFVDAMSVPMAIALSGQLLLSQPVMVKPSEAEKNQAQSTSAAAGPGGVMGPYTGGARRLYVGNLHPNITEDNLRQVFGAFGIVELVQMPLDESGHCKGFGFIQFSRLEDARNALSLNGQLEIAGRMIKVSTVTDQPGLQDIGASTGDLDDEDGVGLSLNASSRASLMQKLDRTGTASSIAGSLGTHVVNNTGATMAMAPILGVGTIPSLGVATSLVSVPAFPGLGAAGVQVPTVAANLLGVGTPSECLLLKNMNSAGFVYLRFANSEAAMDAQRALNGRWFAGKMIGATFMKLDLQPKHQICKNPASGQYRKDGLHLLAISSKFI